MLYPSVNNLLKKVDSRYTLVMLASKRARQLVDGSESEVKIDSNKPVTIAIHEIAHDKVEHKKLDANELE